MGAPSNLPSFKGLAVQIAGAHPLGAEIDKYDSRLDRFLGELYAEMSRYRSCVEPQSMTPIQSRLNSTVRWWNLFMKPEQVRIVTTNFDHHFGACLRNEVGNWTCTMPQLYH